jgi:hypothetical protein
MENAVFSGISVRGAGMAKGLGDLLTRGTLPKKKTPKSEDSGGFVK